MSVGESSEHPLVTWLSRILQNDLPAAAVAESIKENPSRIDRAYQELLSGYSMDPGAILKVTAQVEAGTFRGAVTSENVPFVSMCAHHFLPFFGSVDLAYVPGQNILGIGKIPRLIYCRSRRFQIQEFLVKELAMDMMKFGGAVGVKVTATARHMCVCYRGPDMPSVSQLMTYRAGSAVE